MVAVSEELPALLGESLCVATDLLAHGSALGSQEGQELDAQAALLQSQPDYMLRAPHTALWSAIILSWAELPVLS